MSGARAAIRYAKAALSLAADQKSADIVNADMKLISSTIAESKELSDTLQSPVLGSSIKKAVLLEAFNKANKTTLGLIDALITNKRIDLLAQVATKYIQLYDASNGVENATVTTAVALTSDLEKKMLSKAKELTGKKVELKNIVDESILGGFILRVGDLQYNASVANQLNKLKKEFSLN